MEMILLRTLSEDMIEIEKYSIIAQYYGELWYDKDHQRCIPKYLYEYIHPLVKDKSIIQVREMLGIQ